MPLSKKEIQKLNKLGNRIKQFRKAKGYSNYEQFAFDHNIARAQYGAMKTGQI